MRELLRCVLEYKICAIGASVTAKLYMIAPREVLQDEIMRVHRSFVVRAHTARMRAEGLTNGERD